MAGQTLIAMTPEQITALVKGAVREAMGQAAEAPTYLMLADVAKMLHVCEKTVSKLVRLEGLPEARSVGRERRFERAAVIAWMATRPASVTPLRRVR